MPTLTAHGSADPVTKPSMSPDTASTPTRPIATVNSARASSRERPAARARGPGSIHVQKIRRPAAPATNTAVSSSRPCGAMSWRNTSRCPCAAIMPPTAPTLIALLARNHTGPIPVIPVAMQTAVRKALLVHTIVAKPAPGV